MISQREISAWRAYAPWSDDHLVEQDYLICKSLEAIFSDPFLISQVAMRGGTVLHKGHLAPAARYSEDIDLVIIGDRPASHIRKALNRVLEPIFGKPQEDVFTNIQLTIRNLVAKSKIIRQIYNYDPTSESHAIGTLKVEVNTNECQPLFALTNVAVLVPLNEGAPKQLDVLSYDLNEMLGTKLRALLQREHGRDLFDIFWAYNNAAKSTLATSFDPAKVAEAFRHYMAQEGSTFSKENIAMELERRMKSVKFRKDMDGYLATGQSYDIDKAHAEFIEVFLPHL